MSLWYDIKRKNYSSDAKSSWIRSYVDRVISIFRGETDSNFNSHFSGTLGRHTANDIDCEDGNTLQQKLENETTERLSLDAAIRQEMIAQDTELHNTLELKVDKQDGKSLSSNDYTDEEKAKLSTIESHAQANTVTSVAGKTGAVTLSKSDVGLSEVTNTADFDKPISIAMQNALDLKMNCSDFMPAYNLKADISDVLTKSSPEIFIPSQDYHPATKKYVDDSIGGTMPKNVYDTNNDGIVDNASNLDGQPSSYYAKASQLSSLAPNHHASMDTRYGIGSPLSYGHVRVTDDLNTSDTEGTALSITAGKSLFTLCNSIVSIPPKLTPISPDGTVIGSSDWTGTGWVYTDTNTQYLANDTIYADSSASPAGLVRLCLKPSGPISDFWNWTPRYLCDETVYEFFYSPSRELFEGLIPQTNTPLSSIIQDLIWEKRPAQNLYYGCVSGLLGYYHQDAIGSEDAVNNYFVKNFPSNRDLHFNSFPTKEDYSAAVGYLNGYYPNDKIAELDHNTRNLLYLMLDVDCTGDLTSSSIQDALQSKYTGTLESLPVESIDNGFQGI